MVFSVAASLEHTRNIQRELFKKWSMIVRRLGRDVSIACHGIVRSGFCGIYKDNTMIVKAEVGNDCPRMGRDNRNVSQSILLGGFCGTYKVNIMRIVAEVGNDRAPYGS